MHDRHHPMQHFMHHHPGGRRRWEEPEMTDEVGRRGNRGHHPGMRGGPGGGPRGRAQRGDVRAAILLLLAEEPMHGYQLMRAIAERTSDAWRVSPGAVYPTLAQLEDEGLVRTVDEGGRKLASLTEAGHAVLANPESAPADPFAAMTASGPSGRELFESLAIASRTIARTGTSAQIEAARAVLERARRELYLILADGPVDAAKPE